MKVKCIDKRNNDYITIGKTYEVVYNDGNVYWLTNDNADNWYYCQCYFKTLSEIIKERNEKINKLLE